ncbi:riboflavin synthase subunit alpha [Photobacterium angustum]|uniref:Riboflavin synthase subunit alpha n=1 Tax=Photobacterium angustum TaxID=661 RepID=A0A855SHW6_PHOAN|nr:riboflavin synthase subunit alpha [Photobacterium angustum]KJF82456.1 riboflavin synthase subunit alpha [Photobacterium damselae subsp. damselae]KJG34411.1 riboflavin synthase subunit alpha [Photobacterium angustum]KJG41836.1 riboflavin synthase subunit alpha [Photobacterium angustum]KJG46439.1 riboflavin synthase subunit alpha [Photobacterium angustum]KJG50582.1 riboflavin synthase subunit alpha [Photobacterium angustum]
MTVDVANDAMQINTKKSHSSTTLRITLLTLITILSCYYLWVLYKAVTPNVSIAYKAYYIKTQTLFWQPKEPDLALNIPSSLELSTKVPYLSREGWNKDADNGARLLTNTGGFYFTLPNKVKQDVKVSITLASSLSSPLHFSVNQWHGVFTSTKQTNVFDAIIPASAFKSGDTLQTLQINTLTPLAFKLVDFSFLSLSKNDSHQATTPILASPSMTHN